MELAAALNRSAVRTVDMLLVDFFKKMQGIFEMSDAGILSSHLV